MAPFQKQRTPPPVVDLGDEEPLYTRTISKGPPDRRRVSLRWLSGAVLTGIFSTVLVGGALQAAVGINEDLVVRPVLATGGNRSDSGGVAEKGDRFRPVPESKVTRRVIQISTVTRKDDRDLVRVRPFAHIHTTLAGPVPDDVAAQVPPYSPVDIYSADADQPQAASAEGSDSIYGAQVEGEVSIKVSDFPLEGARLDESVELSTAQVEERVRAKAPFLAEGAVDVASMPYVDPARFDYASTDASAIQSLAVAITPENVSLIAKSEAETGDPQVGEKVVDVAEGASLKTMLTDEGSTDEEATAIQSALIANFAFEFRAGEKLRLGLAEDETGRVRPIRVTLYEGEEHLATVALSDTGEYVAAEAPPLDDELFVSQESEAPKTSGAFPTVHEGLWRTGLNLGIPKPLIENLIRMFSYDVDFQNRLAPADSLEVVYSADGDEDQPEILYASMQLGAQTFRFYRFRSLGDGTTDFFDEDGKTAQKFLMRKPVATGRFSSPFGMRKHPILGTYKLHSGVDWAAPAGTPIMAAGNGSIEKMGKRSGYGNSVTIEHSNGYETTYNHMSGYAKGLSEGEQVRQGQIIGYVGTTGLSTGNHVHFEVLVNHRFVDPMKIRVPRGHELGGAELLAFERERQRIDTLLQRDDSKIADAASD